MIKNNVIFFRQDIMRLRLFIFIVLSFLSGASIIYSSEYLGGGFRVDNVYAMFSTISEFYLMYTASDLFGREFNYKTINLIRISGRGSLEILFRKLLCMESATVIVGGVSWLQMVGYNVVFSKEINLVKLLGSLITAYLLYGLFLFSIGIVIGILLKKTVYTFITILITFSLVPLLIKLLGSIDFLSSFIKYFPFTFVRNSFSFAVFNRGQIISLIIYSVILLIIANVLYTRKGFI
ncbi:ABC transporter permease [Lactococcus hircilactis]|uniref:ABC transporter permease n=1 Tax=Lactococcus hircilactis TaxID=1494462 RepID=A0A7X2CZP5_9LACT|nr:ABC transporter permease [Lactococcus hircilactis]MQW38346.1 ABC transporter permease [Lactococcus hircilactis]